MTYCNADHSVVCSFSVTFTADVHHDDVALLIGVTSADSVLLTQSMARCSKQAIAIDSSFFALELQLLLRDVMVADRQFHEQQAAAAAAAPKLLIEEDEEGEDIQTPDADMT